jgi:two-component system sensor histidine kinase QseC
MISIRRRLLIGLIGLFTLGWLVVMAATYIESRNEVAKLFDAQLEHAAQIRVILWVVANSLDDVQNVKAFEGAQTRRNPREEGLSFQVHKGKQLLFHTPGTPSFLSPYTQGYSDENLNDHDWRVYTVVEPTQSLTVQAGEPYTIRNHLIYEITRNALYPLLLAIPLLAAMIWLGVGRGLSPLKKVSNQVAQRTPSHLNPIETRQVPSEIKIFVDELNMLLGRLREAFDKERQFTANAAHEIRTPLASLKTHAQVALRSKENSDREERLRQIIRGVDRMTHLVEQLLTLARLDYEAQEQKFERVDLASLTREVLAEVAPMAIAKNVDLSLVESSRGEVTGNPVGLAVLVRNLVDNAIRYTPQAGTVEVEVRSGQDGVLLLVTDNGPGIPAGERQHVFDRFYRGQANDALGCGLGLSIVARIVKLHGAAITLNDVPSGSGLQVRVGFPPPQAPNRAPVTAEASR